MIIRSYIMIEWSVVRYFNSYLFLCKEFYYIKLFFFIFYNDKEKKLIFCVLILSSFNYKDVLFYLFEFVYFVVFFILWIFVNFGFRLKVVVIIF